MMHNSQFPQKLALMTGFVVHTIYNIAVVFLLSYFGNMTVHFTISHNISKQLLKYEVSLPFKQ